MKFSKKRILIVCFSLLLLVGTIFLLIFFFSDKEISKIAERKAETITSSLLTTGSTTEDSHSWSTILDDGFKAIGWDNYLYDNKFQKIIFNMWNEENYEEISKILLYTACYQINVVIYQCKESMILDYFTDKANEKYYNVSKEKNQVVVENKKNGKRLRITIGKNKELLLMILK